MPRIAKVKRLHKPWTSSTSGQRQQAADAEGQLEGRFPFSGGSCGNDDSVVLGDLAQAGDEEFPADDNDGDPERAQPGGRQVDESRGDGDSVARGQ